MEKFELLGEPTISVALCTRNGARYIEEQVHSILEQLPLASEIVLSDDASTDDTIARARRCLESYELRHPASRIELILLENPVALGVTRNFEQAIGATRGDLVALCDQDDRWHPNRLERMVREFRRRPELLLLHGNANLVDSRGASLGHTLFDALEVNDAERQAVHSGAALDVFLRRNLATGATTMIRRSLFEIASPFPIEWVHDEWLAIVAASVGQVDLVEESLLDYRQHGNNEIGAQKLSLAGKVRRVFEPRAARNRRIAAASAVLATRLRALGDLAAPDTVHKAEGKLAHETVRMGLPVARARRLRPVLKEAVRGGYASYGRGLADIVRDLLQPAA